MVTEGEFDALIVKQIAEEKISVCSIGSAANKRVNPRWFPKLISAPNILLRMDEDKAGQGASAQISSMSRAVKCVQVPQGKDVNDFFLTTGQSILMGWINEIIENHIS